MVEFMKVAGGVLVFLLVIVFYYTTAIPDLTSKYNTPLDDDVSELLANHSQSLNTLQGESSNFYNQSTTVEGSQVSETGLSAGRAWRAVRSTISAIGDVLFNITPKLVAYFKIPVTFYNVFITLTLLALAIILIALIFNRRP